jgi:sec-independent protein translocase protein TatA
MSPLIGMPQGSEWIIILVIVVLLFGSSKLPSLVKSLGQSKKVWDDEVGKKNTTSGELTQNSSFPSAEQQVPQPTQQPVQQPVQPQAQPQAQPNQVNGDGTPPQSS